jgi:ribosomal protein S18 acetylase RimI-like enzyme
VRLVPADSLDFDALVELFNEAYSDYAVPLRLDRASLEFTLAVCDVELAASQVALADGDRPAAFSFLALRGHEGWIAGMGTVPAHRRQGLGEAALRRVLDEARRRGASSVRLEVIAGNEAARTLYEKLGFRHERDLVVWTLEQVPPRDTGPSPNAVPAADASAWIVDNRLSVEPWQRGDETRAHVRARGVEFAALALERDGERAGAVVYQHAPGLPRVWQIAARDEDAAAALLTAVASAGGGLRFLNVPAADPASRACERLGARAEVRQHEMRLSL